MGLKLTAIVCIAQLLSGAASAQHFDADRAPRGVSHARVRIMPAVMHYCGFINRDRTPAFLQATDPSRPEEGCPHRAAARFSAARTTA